MSRPQREYPESICVRLTRRCNAACSFCQAPNTDRIELTLDQISEISKGLAAVGVRTLKLSGGEPTLRPDLPSIVGAVRRSEIHPVIITNGVRLREEVLDAIAASGAEFKFSVHRPDHSNDDVLQIRSFDAIVANMVACRRRSVAFSLNTVVTERTVDLMEAMARLAIEHGARKISFIPVVPRGRAAAGADEIDRDCLAIVRERIAILGRWYHGELIVRCIDIRSKDYWVIENDGTLWIERWREDLDLRVCGLDDLLALAAIRL